VTEVAANPVSVSSTGYLAIHVALDDGREAIVRTTV
jgi:hypothetical protein